MENCIMKRLTSQGWETLRFINHTYYAIILLGIIIVVDMLFG